MNGQPHKCLEVRTAEERDDTGAWVVVEISDTEGHQSEEMVHLWDMFPEWDGLGFGLWWVRTFIERQGGTISCEASRARVRPLLCGYRHNPV